MKPQIALSPEQMKELKSLGLDCSDASMCWCKEPNENKYRLFIHDEYCYEAACLKPIPAYTLEDILIKLREIFPRYEIKSNMSDYFYIISYPTTDRCGSFKSHASLNNPMQSAFEMLKWVLKNHPDKIKKLER